MTRCCVYELLLDGKVVYVGSTKSPTTRLAAHKHRGVHPTTEMRIVEWYDDVPTARAAERARIKKMLPRHNEKDATTDRNAVYARRKEDFRAAEQRVIDTNAAKWKAIGDELEQWIGENPEEAERTLEIWNPHMSAEKRRQMIDECKRKLK